MKKYLIALVALLVVVTGCGNTKKLTCTETDEGTETVAVMEFDKENAMTKMTVTATEKFEKELTKEELEMYQGISSLACASFTAESVECEVNVTSKELKLVVSYDITKMTDEELAEAGLTKENTTYDAAKKDLEDDGYTCK